MNAKQITMIFSMALACIPVWFQVTQAADLSFRTGGGIWFNGVDGHIRYKDNPSIDVDYLNYDDEIRGYVWGELRHPVPIIPNIRVEYTDVKFSDHSNASFTWEDVVYEANTWSMTKLKQLDLIAFYNLMDTSWFSLDLGVDAKYIDFKFEAQGLGTVSGIKKVLYEEQEKEDVWVPLAYGNVRFNVPGTGLGLEACMKYIAYKSSQALDLEVKVDYLYSFSHFQAGVEAGYRFENIDLDQDDISGLSFDADIDIKGPFTGIVLRF